jgi:hypothetical protein
MGALLEGGPVLAEKDIQVAADLPTGFDSRTEWGSMCPSTLEVRDQAACGVSDCCQLESSERCGSDSVPFFCPAVMLGLWRCW